MPALKRRRARREVAFWERAGQDVAERVGEVGINPTDTQIAELGRRLGESGL